MVYKVRKVLSSHPETKFAVKLTGGEPFLKPSLLKKIIRVCGEYPNIHYVGIGTNGSLPVRNWIKEAKNPLHIYLSRHWTKEWGYPIEYFVKDNNYPLVEYRVNCNLIKGQVDSWDRMINHIEWIKSKGITFICFRELNHLSLENDSMYPNYVSDYIKYYNTHLVPIKDLMKDAEKHGLVFHHHVTNGYDTNYVYIYDGIRVVFRVIDEQALLEFNKSTTEVDEYVLHPDGLLTGCWDRDTKVLEGGGIDAK